ncbi:ribbon-helix-helix protein, CopG family [Micrococcales bacterium 31B]|nr:ribbon-helix-helix protein, CopG family [Micrococcales bacterium 31B]
MPTKKQPEHASGQVVSVRLDAELIKRLDTLALRTQRSRAIYIRLALEELLPRLEAEYWNQQAEAYEADLIEEEFIRITSNMMQDRSHFAPRRGRPPTKGISGDA